MSVDEPSIPEIPRDVSRIHCGLAGAFGYEAESYDFSMATSNDFEAEHDAVSTNRTEKTGTLCGQQRSGLEIETDRPMKMKPLAGVLV